MRCSSILMEIEHLGPCLRMNRVSAVFPRVIHQEDSGLMKCLLILMCMACVELVSDNTLQGSTQTSLDGRLGTE